MKQRDFTSARAKEALLKNKEGETEGFVIRNPDGNVWYNDKYALKQRSMKDKEEKFCGECCWFYGEDTWGYGSCPFRFAELQRCSDKCMITEKYTSKEDMRHYMAVLLQANRYRRDQNVPSIYKMPDQKELGKAIDFAYNFIKTFSIL